MGWWKAGRPHSPENRDLGILSILAPAVLPGPEVFFTRINRMNDDGRRSPSLTERTTGEAFGLPSPLETWPELGITTGATRNRRNTVIYRIYS